MDEQVDDYMEPDPEDQAVEAAMAEDEAKKPRGKKKTAPKPAESSKTALARMNALAKLANAGR